MRYNGDRWPRSPTRACSDEISSDTVNFAPNLRPPPSRSPPWPAGPAALPVAQRLHGIAVGMATSIRPTNLAGWCEALIA